MDYKINYYIHIDLIETLALFVGKDEKRSLVRCLNIVASQFKSFSIVHNIHISESDLKPGGGGVNKTNGDRILSPSRVDISLFRLVSFEL